MNNECFESIIKTNSNELKEKINEQENVIKEKITNEKTQLLQKIDNYEKNILNKKLNEIIKELEINEEQDSNKEREFKPIQFVKNESFLKSLNNFGTLQTDPKLFPSSNILFSCFYFK